MKSGLIPAVLLTALLLGNTHAEAKTVTVSKIVKDSSTTISMYAKMAVEVSQTYKMLTNSNTMMKHIMTIAAQDSDDTAQVLVDTHEIIKTYKDTTNAIGTVERNFNSEWNYVTPTWDDLYSFTDINTNRTTIRDKANNVVKQALLLTGQASTDHHEEEMDRVKQILTNAHPDDPESINEKKVQQYQLQMQALQYSQGQKLESLLAENTRVTAMLLKERLEEKQGWERENELGNKLLRGEYEDVTFDD